MSDIRFVNEYVRDKDTAKEIYGYWHFKRPIMIFVYVMLAVYTLSCLLGFIFDFENAKEFVLPFTLLLVSAFLMVFSYFSQVNAMAKRDAEIANGRELLCETRVSDSEITTLALGNETKIGFENIKYAFVTGGYIVLVTKARLMYIFKKSGFTTGDADSFIAFLLEKGIKVKGKK